MYIEIRLFFLTLYWSVIQSTTSRIPTRIGLPVWLGILGKVVQSHLESARLGKAEQRFEKNDLSTII